MVACIYVAHKTREPCSWHPEIDELRASFKAYATRQRNNYLRTYISDNSGGLLQSAYIRILSVTNIGLGSYIKKEYIKPVKEIAALPPIEIQATYK